MPSPRPDENQDEFLDRCMSDPEAVDDFPDPDQRYAFCQSQWETRAVTVQHKQFLQAIARRRSQNTSPPKGGFGYGVGTADLYLRQVLDTVDELPPALRIDDQAMKRAAGTLTLCQPDDQLERFATLGQEPAASSKLANSLEPADILPKGVEAPANTLMVLQHVVTTPREDRDTDVLLTEGAELDPQAPLLWQHIHTFPMGKVITKLKQDKTVLRVATALLDVNELTSDAAKLIAGGVLRISHGFRVLNYEERKDEDGEPVYGFLIKRFEIMEVSLVSVPSNVEAEIELYAAGKLASPTFKSHAKRLFDARTKQAPGFELSGEGGAAAPSQESSAGEVAPSQGGREGDSKGQPPAAVSTETKRGRVLSQRMQDRLQETVDDLDELEATELSRSQKALVRGCKGRLQECLNEAGDGEDSAQPEPKSAPADPEHATKAPPENPADTKPEPTPDPQPKTEESAGDNSSDPPPPAPAPAAPELTVEAAMQHVIAKADADQIVMCTNALQALQRTHDADAAAAAYRRAIGVF